MNRKIKITGFAVRGMMLAGLFVAGMVQVDAQAQALVSNKMPEIEVVGVGELQRTSANKDKSGLFVPPWTSVEVTNVFGFKVQPRVGSRATFVPIDVDLNQFDLNLKGSTIQDGCERSSPKWWSAEFLPITDPRLFSIRAIPSRSEESPFGVVVIYPAVTSARQIPRSELRPDLLPKGVKLATVKSAIDVTSDGHPDLIITEYCCANAANTTDCDTTCGATYKRSGTKWLKIDTSEPC
jgi:hypothetical protein